MGTGQSSSPPSLPPQQYVSTLYMKVVVMRGAAYHYISYENRRYH